MIHIFGWIYGVNVFINDENIGFIRDMIHISDSLRVWMNIWCHVLLIY